MPYKIEQTCVGCGVCKTICPVGAISGRPEHVYHIDPDLCIGCGACGRKCPHRSIRTPEGKLARRIRIRRLWPRPGLDLQRCTASPAGTESCPVSCLELKPESGSRDTIRQPFLSRSHACISCGFCQQACPVDAITMQNP